ncbi:unnamed protein product [Ilex paraguariensis]|uniref:F-box domain-containing protein n=1 Tax=Ilex paraguariensis TaxID=185542 RepID=A0ABC8UIG8_9AQUA
MSTFLRKVWESVSYRSNSNSNSNYDYTSHCSSTGAFDRLPLDIFIIIVKFLGPKDSAKLCAVCKSWKLIVSDNRLWIYFLQNQREPWDSNFFGETHLRLGYPHRTFPYQMPELSFMHIYGQRAQVPGSVIIEVGSGYCKFGWSKYASPSGRFATFLEFGNIESPIYSRLRHFFATIYSRMQVKTSTQPVVVSVPICHYDDTESAKAARRQLKETIYMALFDMNVPAVCAINQVATLALFAARRTSGIVVNIGFHQTSVVPVFHGQVMRKVGVEVMGMGALKLTGFLREQMQQHNMHFDSLYTVRSLKENLCYVALDYEAELAKDTQASFKVAEALFTLSKERFQTGEILFQPRLAGVRAMGLQQAVALCIDHCQDAELTGDDGWFKTVVLAGGVCVFTGTIR